MIVAPLPAGVAKTCWSRRPGHPPNLHKHGLLSAGVCLPGLAHVPHKRTVGPTGVSSAKSVACSVPRPLISQGIAGVWNADATPTSEGHLPCFPLGHDASQSQTAPPAANPKTCWIYKAEYTIYKAEYDRLPCKSRRYEKTLVPYGLIRCARLLTILVFTVLHFSSDSPTAYSNYFRLTLGYNVRSDHSW